MRLMVPTITLIALQCILCTGQDVKEDRIGGLNLYQGDDASALLQEAFAQAGVDLGGPITPVIPPTRRLSLVDRLRSIKLPLPSFASLTRRKVTPVPSALIPVMAGPPHVRAVAPPSREVTFIPAHNDYNTYSSQPSYMPTYTFPQESEVPKDPLIASPSQRSTKTRISESVVRATRRPLSPMPSQVDNQIVSYSKTPNSSTSSVWTPSSQYFGGFKPIPATSAKQGSVSMSSAVRSDGKKLEKSNSLSGEETKRVSFYESLDQEKAAFAYTSKFKHNSKSMDFWKLNDSQIQEPATTAQVLKAGKSENKLFPISPAMLLEQMARMNSSRSSQDCRNKDLGWCDFSENYPEHFVLAVIKECRDMIERMYVEVPQNLADFDDFVPFSPISSFGNHSSGSSNSSPDSWSWAGQKSKKKALCDADRKFVRPSVAQDITGRWFVIVQSSLYHQQIPTELCRSPGEVCNNIAECGLSARCVQKFNTQLLVSIDLDKDSDCPSMRLYRFPSGCVCDNASYY